MVQGVIGQALRLKQVSGKKPEDVFYILRSYRTTKNTNSFIIVTLARTANRKWGCEVGGWGCCTMQQYRWTSESTQKMKMRAAGVLGPGQSHSATPLPRWCRCQTHQWQRSRGSHRGRHVTRGREGTIHKKARFRELQWQAIACCCRCVNHSSDLSSRVLCVTVINSLERRGGGGMMIEEEVVVGEMATLWERRSADSSGMHEAR